MGAIDVTPVGEGYFEVEIRDGGSATTHRVSVSEAERERFGEEAEAVELVEESFRFLLEREPAGAILSRFELSAIERYFPEYPDRIRARLERR